MRFERILLACAFLCAGCGTTPVRRAGAMPSIDLPGSSAAPFETALRWKDWRIVVRVLSSGEGRVTWYEVRSSRVGPGGERLIQRTTYDSDGVPAGAWLSDLRGNGWPVLVLAFTDGGRMRYGSIRLIQCDERGFHALAAPNTLRTLLDGYRGGDRWGCDERGLTRVFPIYMEGDEPGSPSGGERLLRYQWKGGQWRVRYHNEKPPASSGPPSS